MSLFRDDLEIIAGPQRPPQTPEVVAMGMVSVIIADGSTVYYDLIMVEATLTDGRGKRICSWVRTPAYIMPGTYRPGRNNRLDGQWIRRSLYTGSAPTQTRRIIHYVVATERRQLRLPDVSQDERPTPDIPPFIPYPPGVSITLKQAPLWVADQYPKKMPVPAPGVRN